MKINKSRLIKNFFTAVLLFTGLVFVFASFEPSSTKAITDDLLITLGVTGEITISTPDPR